MTHRWSHRRGVTLVALALAASSPSCGGSKDVRIEEPTRDAGAAAPSSPGVPGEEPGLPTPNGETVDAAAPPAPGVSAEAAGCDGAKLLALPKEPEARGPWPVGARTVTVGTLTTEVWYPAVPGSDTGRAKERYDVRLQLPDEDRD